MYKALLDRESITHKEILEDLTVVAEYEEYWPGEEPGTLHILKICIQDRDARNVIHILEKELEEEWFAVVWSNTQAHVVFKGITFTLRNCIPWERGEYEQLVSYGATHGISEKYFKNMRTVMDAW